MAEQGTSKDSKVTNDTKLWRADDRQRLEEYVKWIQLSSAGNWSWLTDLISRSNKRVTTSNYGVVVKFKFSVILSDLPWN